MGGGGEGQVVRLEYRGWCQMAGTVSCLQLPGGGGCPPVVPCVFVWGLAGAVPCGDVCAVVVVDRSFQPRCRAALKTNHVLDVLCTLYIYSSVRLRGESRAGVDGLSPA